jgi:hypothetical protein
MKPQATQSKAHRITWHIRPHPARALPGEQGQIEKSLASPGLPACCQLLLLLGCVLWDRVWGHHPTASQVETKVRP